MSAPRTARLEDGERFFADGGMTARYWPEVGDYVVSTTQPDGREYVYINPRAVFENKYQAIEAVEGVTESGEVVSAELAEEHEDASA